MEAHDIEEELEDNRNLGSIVRIGVRHISHDDRDQDLLAKDEEHHAEKRRRPAVAVLQLAAIQYQTNLDSKISNLRQGSHRDLTHRNCQKTSKYKLQDLLRLPFLLFLQGAFRQHITKWTSTELPKESTD